MYFRYREIIITFLRLYCSELIIAKGDRETIAMETITESCNDKFFNLRLLEKVTNI